MNLSFFNSKTFCYSKPHKQPNLIRVLALNITIFGAIFTCFILVLFSFDSNFMSKLVDQKIWFDLFDGEIQDIHTKHLSNQEIYYIKVNSNNKIIETHISAKISEKVSNSIAYAALNSRYVYGEIEITKNVKFIFYKINFTQNGSTTIIFADSKLRLAKQERLVTKMVYLIIFSLILLFLGSLAISSNAIKAIKKSWNHQIDFTANASHELRTPLSIIQTHLELLINNPDEDPSIKEKWLGNSYSECKRMAKLIHNLLILSRSDANQINVCKNFFNISDAATTILKPLISTALIDNIEVTYHIEKSIIFFGDEELFKQLIVILVDNAIKYCSRESGKVIIKLCKKNNSVELLVSDNGKGIEKEHLNKIFNRFYRGYPSRTGKNEAFGLGLAIAKEIVSEHKGKIMVSSSINKGTIFKVILPITKKFLPHCV